MGSYGAAQDTVEYIQKHLKRNISDLRYIIATHFHIDHIGGIGHLIKKCEPTTKVLFNYRVKDYLSGKKKISCIKSWFTGKVPVTLASARYVRRLSQVMFMK